MIARQFGKQFETMRRERDGQHWRTVPSCESPRPAGSLPHFCLSGLVVAAGPAVLAFAADDWPVAFAMVAWALFVGLVSAYTSAHRPHWTYPFTFGLAIIAFVMIGVMLWRPSHWEPEFTNYLVWFTGALQFMAVAFAILSVLVSRRSVAGQD